MKKATIAIMLTIMAACQKEPIRIALRPEAKKESEGPKIRIEEGICSMLYIEGIQTKSDTPLVTIRHRGRTDSIAGQASADGPIYISFCLERQRWLRRKWNKRRTEIAVIDEDGKKTIAKKGRE